MRRTLEYFAVFSIGAAGYSLIEILWRGYTHWTMALTGGICLVLIYETERRYSLAPLWKRCVVGALTITMLELFVGFLVNIVLGWAVWDYSDQPLNLFGQICPLYCALWLLLCAPLTGLCTRLGMLFEKLFKFRVMGKEHRSM